MNVSCCIRLLMKKMFPRYDVQYARYVMALLMKKRGKCIINVKREIRLWLKESFKTAWLSYIYIIGIIFVTVVEAGNRFTIWSAGF